MILMILLELLLFGFLFFLISLFAGAETAMISASKLKLHQMAEEGNRYAITAEKLVSSPRRLLGTVLVGTNIALVGTTVLSTILTRAIWGESAVALSSIVMIPAVLIFGEIIPKTYAAHNADKLTLRLSHLIKWASTALYPFVILFVSLPTSLLRLLGADRSVEGALGITEEEIRTMVALGEEAGELEEEEKEMIHSIFEFGDTSAHEVMVPRTDMTAIDVTAPLKDALDLVLDTGHSRIPVYEDTVDNVIGIIYARDLLACMRDKHTDAGIRETMRPAYYVPEAKKVDDLLRELRRRRVHMAIVIDEYGGTAGLVTIEDLLEEIVGEIRDEYDVQEEELFRILDENTYLVDGRMSIDEINEMLDVRIPKDGFDSIGGYIFSEIGDIPGVGERLELPDLGLELVIDKTDGRRISKVKIIKYPAQAEEEE